jgi:hypothetical protein
MASMVRNASPPMMTSGTSLSSTNLPPTGILASRVNQLNTAKPAYRISATQYLLSNELPCSAIQKNSAHFLWCTGEDSNLRSSQGAADLQSAAINRSATCAQPIPLPNPASAHTNLPESLRLSEHAPQWEHRRGWIQRFHSPAEPKICCRPFPESVSKWSWRRDLNPRPSDYKSDALPAELRQPDHRKNIAGKTPGDPRTHSNSAHNTAQFLRLAHRKRGSNRCKPHSKSHKNRVARRYSARRKRASKSCRIATAAPNRLSQKRVPGWRSRAAAGKSSDGTKDVASIDSKNVLPLDFAAVLLNDVAASQIQFRASGHVKGR